MEIQVFEPTMIDIDGVETCFAQLSTNKEQAFTIFQALCYEHIDTDFLDKCRDFLNTMQNEEREKRAIP